MTHACKARPLTHVGWTFLSVSLSLSLSLGAPRSGVVAHELAETNATRCCARRWHRCRGVPPDWLWRSVERAKALMTQFASCTTLRSPNVQTPKKVGAVAKGRTGSRFLLRVSDEQSDEYAKVNPQRRPFHIPRSSFSSS